MHVGLCRWAGILFFSFLAHVQLSSHVYGPDSHPNHWYAYASVTQMFMSLESGSSEVSPINQSVGPTYEIWTTQDQGPPLHWCWSKSHSRWGWGHHQLIASETFDFDSLLCILITAPNLNRSSFVSKKYTWRSLFWMVRFHRWASQTDLLDLPLKSIWIHVYGLKTLYGLCYLMDWFMQEQWSLGPTKRSKAQVDQTAHFLGRIKDDECSMTQSHSNQINLFSRNIQSVSDSQSHNPRNPDPSSYGHNVGLSNKGYC